MELSGALHSGAWPATTASKYLALKSIVTANAKSYADNEFDNARASLHIPGSPDYHPALSLMKQRFHALSKTDARARLPPGMAHRAKYYLAFRRLEEVLKESQHSEINWVIGMRSRLFTEEELAAFKDVWRRQLLAFGLKDAQGDLETVVTWAPDCYWIRARDEELRMHSSAG